MNPDAFALIRDCVLLAAIAVALYTDLTRGKVFDWCTWPAIGLGLLVNYVAGAVEPAQGNVLSDALGRPLIQSLMGLGLATGIFGTAWLLGMLGGGDVKLLAAVGAIEGWKFFFNAAVFTACAGAIIAVAVLVWRGRLGPGLRRSAVALVMPWRLRRQAESAPEGSAELTRIPYVIAIAVGTLVAWLFSRS